MTIETKKVASVNEAIEIINRLNYRHDTFCYEQTTREDNADIKYRHFDAYRANGEKDGFAMLEIVVNGKLEVVRFYNLFRDITVDLRLGNFTPNYGRYNEIINVDETKAEDNVEVEVEADDTEVKAEEKPAEVKAETEVEDSTKEEVNETAFATFAKMSKEDRERELKANLERLGGYRRSIATLKIFDTAEAKEEIKRAETEIEYILIANRAIEAVNAQETTAEDSVEATAETNDTDDELIDPPDRRTVERNSGNYGEFINGEYVRFENHSIVYIDADRKRGFHFCKVNGKKFFCRQCGHKIAAAKIIERYMNGEIAAEQSKAISDFFFAHKLELCKPFNVSFEITTADGQEHFFSRTFDTFAEAKALVDEFTSTFSEPTLIVITQNKQGGDWYYSRDVDGTEKFFDAFCKMNSAAEDKAEEKNFTANCYYTYTKDGDKRNGLESKKFATATEAAIWILNYVRENGYTLVDGTNIRDCTDRKEYFMSESDFSAAKVETENHKLTKEQIEKRMSEIAIERGEFYDALEEAEADEDISQNHIDYLKGEIDSLMEEYNALWAQLTNIKKAEAKTEVTKTEVKPAKVDRLDELKAKKSSLISAISHSLENHFIKLDNGEFVNASDAGFTTIGIDSARPEFDKLYFKDDSGEYVEVSDKALDALHRLEVWFSYNAEAIKAEIAKTKFKFEVGKWYASDETDWNGNPYGTYRVLKRTKKFVTIYDPDIDDWHYIDNYDPDDEIDGEFDCIFRKKIQYDERGEYVDWRDDDGDLVTLCAKDETDKPVDDDDPKDEIDDTEDEIDAAEDNVEVESVNGEKPEHTTDDELNQPPTAEELNKMFDKTIVNANAMNVTLQNGRKIWETHFTGVYVTPEYYFKHWFIKDDVGFLSVRYDTPEQVETVINMLKAAIERGDKEFTFPTVDELNQPSKDDLRDSLERAIEIARQKYREYKREGDKAGMRHESELFEICRKAVKELEVA